MVQFAMFNQLPKRWKDKIEIEPNSSCWLWKAGLIDGYGWTTVGSKSRRAHAAIYELFFPPANELHHSCHIRRCVNPLHLQPVTKKEHRKEHPKKRPTHCKYGHLFDKIFYTRSHPTGQQQCSICLKRIEAKYRNKHRSGRPPGRSPGCIPWNKGKRHH